MHDVPLCMQCGYDRTDKGEERDSVSPFFFLFRLVDLGSRASVEIVGPRGMGMEWDGMG
jgi:hypothetical protein